MDLSSVSLRVIPASDGGKEPALAQTCSEKGVDGILYEIRSGHTGWKSL